MRVFAILAAVLMPSAALAGSFPVSGAYASDASDCANNGPLNGRIVIRPDMLRMPELECDAAALRRAKHGYVAVCAMEDVVPYRLAFRLKRRGDGTLLYTDKFGTQILHRCR